MQGYHIFAYLKANHNVTLVFDPTYLPMDPNQFRREDWRTFNGNKSEDLHPTAPLSNVKRTTTTAYVDADHASNTVTKKSRTGYIIYLNNDLIY